MRVVHFALFHKAIKTPRIFHRECVTLAQAGYEVHMITADVPADTLEGVLFHQGPRPRSSHLGYIWFYTIWGALWKAFRLGLDLDADLYHIHEAELIPVGVCLKLRGKRVIFDAIEDHPQQIFHVDDGRLHRHLYAQAMRVYIRFLYLLARLFFDAIIVCAPKIGRYFPPQKTTHLYNYSILREYPDAPLDAMPYHERKQRVFYVGGITRKRAIVEIVTAMGLLPERLNPHLLLIGPWYNAQLRSEVETLPGWEYIDAPGLLPHSEMIPEMLDSQVGIVVLHGVSQYTITYPTKLFEYMAAGLPVVSVDLPHWREMLAEYADVVMWVDSHDPRAIADAIIYLLDHPDEAEARGRRGREAVETRFNWEAESQKLLDLYAQFATT